MDFQKIVAYGLANNASDIHMSPGAPIFFRILGKLVPVGQPLLASEIQQLISSLLTLPKLKDLEINHHVGFVVQAKLGTRLRGNAFIGKNGLSVSFRLILPKIPDFSFTGFPKFILEDTLKLKQGIVFIVGNSGQGKTTSLSILLQSRLNENTDNVITLEDPIEYLFSHGKGVVHQREVGQNVNSFLEGMDSALWEDPDVVMVSDIKDYKSLKSVVGLAESGHLVFATMRSDDTVHTITRLLDEAPSEDREQLQLQLARVLSRVIAQKLLLHKNGKQRVMAFEVLTNNYAVANAIRQDKVSQIPTIIQTDDTGEFVSFEQSLGKLVLDNKITKEQAFEQARDPNYLETVLDTLDEDNNDIIKK